MAVFADYYVMGFFAVPEKEAGPQSREEKKKIACFQGNGVQLNTLKVLYSIYSKIYIHTILEPRHKKTVFINLSTIQCRLNISLPS